MSEKEKISALPSDGYDWTKIRLEYVTTDITYQELCDKHGCSMSVLSKRASAEKWREERKKQRKRIETKTKEKVADRVAEKNAKALVSCKDLAEQLLPKLSQAIDELNTHILKLQIQEDFTKNDEKNGLMEVTKKTEKLKKVKSIIKTDDLKKISAAIKDINDVLSESETTGSGQITVVLEGDINEYGA